MMTLNATVSKFKTWIHKFAGRSYKIGHIVGSYNSSISLPPLSKIDREWEIKKGKEIGANYMQKLLTKTKPVF